MSILVDVYRIFYQFCLALTGSHGWALMLMSLLTSFAVEPFKRLTEGVQAKECKLRTILDPNIAEIRRNHKGAERHARIAQLYHKYSYHPIYAIRASLGILLQVPLLFAAYTMLSAYQPIHGMPFLWVEDLGRPDGFLWGVNVLPFIMTLLNLMALYLTPNFRRSDYIQGMSIAALFLVLLYSASAALLIYWTCNNAIYVVRGLYTRYATAKKPLLNLPFGLDAFNRPAEKPSFLTTAAYLLLPFMGLVGVLLSEALILLLIKRAPETEVFCGLAIMDVILLLFFLYSIAILIYQPVITEIKKFIITMCLPWIIAWIYHGF